MLAWRNSAYGLVQSRFRMDIGCRMFRIT
ncbi:MAG: hypothetical protein EZS28_050276, partial [Streblomastix strix]